MVVERRRREVVRMDMVEERCIVYMMRSLEYAGAGRSRDGARERRRDKRCRVNVAELQGQK